LHKKYKTPVNSILFVGAITLAFSLVPLIDVMEQEAFQILDNAATMFYALIYIVLFAIPFVAMSRFGVKAPLWLKIASASGLLVSVVAGFYAMFPIKAVDRPLAFALKIFFVVVVANVIGVVLYAVRGRKSSRAASEQ
jgi:amino acid transporter